MDLEKESAPNQIIDKTVEKFGQIDVLVHFSNSPPKFQFDSQVNNAGTVFWGKEGVEPFMLPIENFDRTISVNLRS